jgi:uncharacterized protein YjiS (DUF1127 family)
LAAQPFALEISLAFAASRHCVDGDCAAAAQPHIHNLDDHSPGGTEMAHASLEIARRDRLGIRAYFQRAADALREHARYRNAYRSTLAELHSMSDRELADFGFHRSELPGIARQAARKA